MKRALIPALVLALAGCGASKDDEYIDKLVDADVLPADVDQRIETAYIDIAHTWCERLAEPGFTRAEADRVIADYAASATADGLSVAQAGLILGSAVEVYCPEDGARIAR